ncbi:hypothetical protein ALQ56_200469 [Pseudomonas syringae pv. papulans]|nr:hypothetical protein ALQ56_200469 [Pseudomonas syringae pv. papulans]
MPLSFVGNKAGVLLEASYAIAGGQLLPIPRHGLLLIRDDRRRDEPLTQ